MILKRRIGRSRIYDTLHKTVVGICIAVTCVGMVSVGGIFYKILTHKPQKTEESVTAAAVTLSGGADVNVEKM